MYLDSTKMDTVSTAFLIIAIIGNIFFLTILSIKSLIINAYAAFMLRIYLEVVVPIGTCVTIPILFALTYDSIVNGWSGYETVAILASILYVANYFIITMANSQTIYVQKLLFTSWNSWYDFFRILFPQVAVFFLLIPTPYGSYVYFIVLLFYSVVQVYFTVNLIYFVSNFNMFQLSVSLMVLLSNVIGFFRTSFDIHYTIFIYLFLAGMVFVVPIAYILMKYSISHFIKFASDDNDDDYNEHSSELEELSASDGEKEIHQFPRKVSKQIRTIFLLRYYTKNGDPTSILLANHIVHNPNNYYVFSEALRHLMIQRRLNDDLQSIILEQDMSSFPWYCKQILCDCQFEAIGAYTSSQTIEPFISNLNEQKANIVDSLYAIIDELQLGDKNYLTDSIIAYSNACSKYESYSDQYLAHSPNSSLLASHISNYYIQMRGNYGLGKLWASRAEVLEKCNNKFAQVMCHYNSSSYSRFRGVMASSSSGKMSETSDTNKLKNQDAMSRVVSKTVIGSVIFLCLIVALCLFNAFYRVKSNDISYIIETDAHESLYEIYTIMYQPLIFQTLYAINHINSTDGSVNMFIVSVSKVLISLINISQYSHTMELNVRFLSSLPNDSKHKKSLYKYWGTDLVDIDDIDFPVSFLMYNILSFMDSKVEATPNEILSTYSNLTYNALNLLDPYFKELDKFLDQVIVDYKKLFISFYGALEAVFLVLEIITIVFYIKRMAYERQLFFDICLDIDEKIFETLHDNLTCLNFGRSIGTIPDNTILKLEEQDDLVLNDDEIELPKEESVVILRYDDDNEIISRIESNVNRFHPRYIPAFIAYTVIFIVLVTIVTFVPGMKSINSLTKFYERKTDINKFDHLLIRVINIASTCSVAISYLDGDDFQNMMLHVSLLNMHMYEEMLELEGKVNDEKTFKTIIQAAKEVYDSVNSWQRDGYKLDISFFKIVRVAEIDTKDVLSNLRKSEASAFKEYSNSISLNSNIFGALIGVLIVLYVVMFGYSIIGFYQEFESMKSIIMLLPSPYFSICSKFINQYMNHSTKKDKTVDSMKFQSRYIIKQSLDAIIVIDGEQRIIDANKSTEELLGYRNDELISQKISTIIAKKEEHGEGDGEFITQLTYFSSRTEFAGSVPKFNIEIIRNDMILVPMSCTLISLHSQDPDPTKPAIALVLTDRSAFNLQAQQLQDAKQAVVQLLNRIMPRVMAMKLLSGNSQTHWKVENTTVVFIGIVNFLDWCKTHKGNEIMDQLDILFTMFDYNITKFKTLVKLKIINGVYMAAGGLFNEVSDKTHPIEAVEFALKCAKKIRKRNKQVGSQIKLVVGINTDGPIIAGVLGKNTPLFDIWGDAVNVSSRLETSSLPDQIQMSLKTMNALPEGKYPIHQRDGVFLKGKGNATTYYIDFEEYFSSLSK